MQVLVSHLISLFLGISILCLGVFQLIQCDFSMLTGFGISRILLSLTLVFFGIFTCLSQFLITIPPVEKSWKNIMVETNYTGPTIKKRITHTFAVELYNYFRTGNGVAKLNKRDVYRIIEEGVAVLQTRDSLTRITLKQGEKITLVGDIHGQFFDLCTIFRDNGLPSSDNPYLFNGDLVDRGKFSVENVLVLFSFMISNPESVYIAKGNHETTDVNWGYGFRYEVLSKYDNDTFMMMTTALRWLPYAHLINNKVFIVHGGLPPVHFKLEQINDLERGVDPCENSFEMELLWNDPMIKNGSKPSYRGAGHLFGPDVVDRFLEENKLDLVIRSHELKAEGFDYFDNKKMMTLFSAPNYSGINQNKGAYVKMKCADKIEFQVVQFSAAKKQPDINLAPNETIEIVQEEIDGESLFGTLASFSVISLLIFAIVNAL
ncbi:serine/threonine protein phosphatase, putative [Entamoeba invadens IP1]|uniref:serine/threonine protein phosphatase, putative n=1 Tax=Entamoeba invadens IP1 TaxID=370355 RepID=UPI0002C3DA78|nr:serine/threonine protein phosphatase, putative [Entamoeba invadens IP1]ELP94146.1 serine/threonine protein phosphatase, putative [Entamoeba invadens IP1]|eukprot:XP_004260917.1 serine/threonine protein phosphatase, putative [Entamoeba invadens IP1]